MYKIIFKLYFLITSTFNRINGVFIMFCILILMFQAKLQSSRLLPL